LASAGNTGGSSLSKRQLQNEAIQTEIKLARESSRSGWIQNGIFFFLGILIPVFVQIAFRFF
jgi:hypothetical protein